MRVAAYTSQPTPNSADNTNYLAGVPIEPPKCGVARNGLSYFGVMPHFSYGSFARKKPAAPISYGTRDTEQGAAPGNRRPERAGTDALWRLGSRRAVHRLLNLSPNATGPTKGEYADAGICILKKGADIVSGLQSPPVTRGEEDRRSSK
jgi:hypothetical protein